MNNDDGPVNPEAPTSDEIAALERRIAELEAVEQRLKEQARELRLKDHLVRSAASAIALGNLDGVVTYVNPAFLAAWGCREPDEIIGRHFTEVWLVKDIADEIMADLMSEKGTWSGEIQARRMDGSVFDVLATAATVFDESGTPIALTATALDITERKQMEADLRESEERFRTIFSNAADIMYIVELTKDKGPLIVDANVSATAAFGYCRDELIGMPIAELDDPEATEQVPERIRRIMAGEKLTFEISHLRKDGSRFPLEVSPTLISIGGRPHIFTVQRDITERKKAEEALRESEQRFRTVFHNATDSMFIVAVGVESDNLIVDANHSAAAMLGYARQELIGMSLTELQAPEATAKGPERTERLMTGGRVTFETYYTRKDGRQVPLEVSQRLLLIGGKPHVYSVGRNITERKKAEEALRESEQRFRTVFNNATDSMLIIEMTAEDEPVIVDTNDSATELFGYSQDELIGQSTALINNPESVQQAPERYKKLRKGEKVTFETEHVRKDGSTVHLEIALGLITIGGRPYIHAAHRDITERRKAVAALRESEERFRTVFNNATDIMFILELSADGGLVIADVNSAVTDVLGYARDEMIGRPMTAFGGRGSKGRLPEVHRKLMDGKQVTYETVRPRKDGARLTFEVSIRRVLIGDKPYAHAVCRDITERKKAEQELRASEERFRTVFNSAMDSMFIAALTGDRGPVIVDANDSAAKLFGFSRDELIGMLVTEFHNPEAVHVMPGSMNTLVSGGRLTFEAPYVRKDGSALVVDMSMGMVSIGGEPHIHVVCRDITDRKKSEDALRESEERFRTVFNNATDIMLISEMSAEEGPVIVDANTAATKLSGYSRDELIGMRIAKFEAPETMEAAPERQRRLMAGELVAYESPYVMRDGSTFLLETSLMLVSIGGKQFVYSVSRDITERKKAEEELRASEERFRGVFDNATDSMFIIELTSEDDAVVVDANVSATELFRCSRAELIGMPITQVDNFDPPEVVAERNRLVRSGARVTMEGCHRRKDGSVLPLEVSLRTIMIGGKPYVHVAHRDITERKKAEEDLRASEERFRGVFDNATDSMFIVELVTAEYAVIVDVNDSATELFRCSRDELIGAPIAQFDNYDPPELVAERNRRIRSGERVTMESCHVRKDGSILPLELSLRTIMIGGKPYVHVAHRDITERKRAEADLRKAKSYIANIINSMPSMLVSVDPDGVITQWNKEAERVTGMTTREALGRNLDSVVPQLSVAMDKVREAIRSRQEVEQTKKARKHRGETRYEDVTIYPLVANGVDGAVIRIDDVTAQVRVEQMMVQSEKMLSVGGLAAGMAHEINNPLAGMIQTASVMSTRLTDLDLPANRRAADEAGLTMESLEKYMEARGIVGMLQRIRESGARAAEIVSNMLSFARKSDQSHSSHDLAELLDQAVDLAGSDYDLKRYDFRQIEIVRDYQAELPLLACEKTSLQQVLLNILRNGAEAMHQLARASEDHRPRFILRLRYAAEAERLRIEIEDNGPGMDEEVRKRVFEPFFTTKPVGVGTGLGLSVSYFIVTENYEGEMTVESQLGSGAKFIISLPLQRRRLLEGSLQPPASR